VKAVTTKPATGRFGIDRSWPWNEPLCWNIKRKSERSITSARRESQKTYDQPQIITDTHW